MAKVPDFGLYEIALVWLRPSDLLLRPCGECAGKRWALGTDKGVLSDLAPRSVVWGVLDISKLKTRLRLIKSST